MENSLKIVMAWVVMSCGIYYSCAQQPNVSYLNRTGELLDGSEIAVLVQKKYQNPQADGVDQGAHLTYFGVDAQVDELNICRIPQGREFTGQCKKETQGYRPLFRVRDSLNSRNTFVAALPVIHKEGWAVSAYSKGKPVYDRPRLLFFEKK